MKLNKISLVSSAFLLLVIGYLFLVSSVLAAPTQNPPNGGVIQITGAPPQASLTIGVSGSYATFNFNSSSGNGALPLAYGGTGRPITDSASKALFRNDVLAAQGNGPNSDITALNPQDALNNLLDLTLGNSGKYVILNGNVGVGTSTINSANGWNLQEGDGTGSHALAMASAATGANSIWFMSGSPVSGGINGGIQYDNSAGTLSFYAGGTGASANRLTILNTGNIGIGTAGPTGQLHLVKAGGASIYLGDSNNTDAIKSVQVGTGSELSFSTNGTGAERMRIDQNGNVGIGTTGPQGLLDVNGGATDTSALFIASAPSVTDRGGAIFHQGSTYAWQEDAQGTASSTTGGLNFNYVNRTAPGTKVTSNVLFLEGDGKVGIGTATPGSKLEVNGNMKLSGATPTYTLTNVAAPSGASDVATKGYVDGAVGAGSAASKSQFFTSNGTFNQSTCSCTLVWVSLVGGGGGGGGGSSGGGAGGGGGAGEAAVKYSISLAVGGSYTVTVGSGGTGGAHDVNGGDGGSSSFGDFVKVAGGKGGGRGNGGGSGTGGAGGTSTGSGAGTGGSAGAAGGVCGSEVTSFVLAGSGGGGGGSSGPGGNGGHCVLTSSAQGANGGTCGGYGCSGGGAGGAAFSIGAGVAGSDASASGCNGYGDGQLVADIGSGGGGGHPCACASPGPDNGGVGGTGGGGGGGGGGICSSWVSSGGNGGTGGVLVEWFGL